MGVWPGNKYFGYRYDYAQEYVQVMKDLWSNSVSNFKGSHFKMEDCKLSPKPTGKIPIIAAGQSDRGTKFASEFADYNFTSGKGINTPTAFKEGHMRLVEAAKTTGRDVGGLVRLQFREPIFITITLISGMIGPNDVHPRRDRRQGLGEVEPLPRRHGLRCAIVGNGPDKPR
jgi:alkanesulfonate monooxygenase SsuD/methylene tetrahydromethanopterin reductase-like flavin-dependent oxidoreductase (luciferase family)